MNAIWSPGRSPAWNSTCSSLLAATSSSAKEIAWPEPAMMIAALPGCSAAIFPRCMQSSAHCRVFSDRVRLILLTIGSGSAGGKTLDPGLNLELGSAVLVRQNRGEQVLTPFDDYPVHQTALPIAHAGARHHVDWAPGLRRSQGAALTFSR